MAVFKCKLCGGSLEVDGKQSVTVCEYCGTKQTLPKLEDERKAQLYDRAGHFRRNNDFDKAMAIYEQILNEDNTDAESYWSILLCRYGIEYVEDPATHTRIPTINRAQFTSIFDDEDYRSALKYANDLQREIYVAEATAINEIQKGILSISQKEEPFDIFICYKETDAGGRRTQDSVLATELYHELTDCGYKVFFSRITLEDKLGIAYEPYIFAALNSAKVMVVLGTRAEHFEAVWVRNEWSRYLARIRSGAKKTLIPAYRDMNPYDLPEEFSHLQALDMSKLGFMQDLVHGIKKIIPSPAAKAERKESHEEEDPTLNPATLLKRAFIFLEDGDWRNANEYCEKVLDIEPENAQAYLGKLMAEIGVRRQDDLKNLTAFPVNNANYQKIMRFSDYKLKATLAGYIEHIKTRNQSEYFKKQYTHAQNIMKNNSSENAYKEAAKLFGELGDYENSKELAKQCFEKAEVARKNSIFGKGMARMSQGTIQQYEYAILTFESIPGWREADAKIAECRERIEELKVQAELKRQEKEKRNKRTKKILSITIPIVCAVILVVSFLIVLFTVILPASRYNAALSLMMNGQYEEACDKWEALGNYRDSAELLTECRYQGAIVLLNEGEYDQALSTFQALDGYRNSEELIIECHYQKATALLDSGRYKEAIAAFESLDGYKDSAKKISACTIKLLNEVKIGNYIKFGTYEQDNNTANGKEAIEWLVLDIKDGKALVLSKYALDCLPYNSEYARVTWSSSSLRSWLNTSFLNTAFAYHEKTVIATETVPADDNLVYADTSDAGNPTKDKIFLLSTNEVYKYLTYDRARQCQATKYAIANGASVESSTQNCRWWLRTPGRDQYTASGVLDTGLVSEYGNDVNYVFRAVRPAMWIDLNT